MFLLEVTLNRNFLGPFFVLAALLCQDFFCTMLFTALALLPKLVPNIFLYVGIELVWVFPKDFCIQTLLLFCGFYIWRRLIVRLWAVDIGHSHYYWIGACTAGVWACWQILNVVKRPLRRFFLLLPDVLIDPDCGLFIEVILRTLVKVRFCEVFISRKQRNCFFTEHCLQCV